MTSVMLVTRRASSRSPVDSSRTKHHYQHTLKDVINNNKDDSSSSSSSSSSSNNNGNNNNNNNNNSSRLACHDMSTTENACTLCGEAVYSCMKPEHNANVSSFEVSNTQQSDLFLSSFLVGKTDNSQNDQYLLSPSDRMSSLICPPQISGLHVGHAQSGLLESPARVDYQENNIMSSELGTISCQSSVETYQEPETVDPEGEIVHENMSTSSSASLASSSSRCWSTSSSSSSSDMCVDKSSLPKTTVRGVIRKTEIDNSDSVWPCLKETLPPETVMEIAQRRMSTPDNILHATTQQYSSSTACSGQLLSHRQNDRDDSELRSPDRILPPLPSREQVSAVVDTIQTNGSQVTSLQTIEEIATASSSSSMTSKTCQTSRSLSESDQGSAQRWLSSSMKEGDLKHGNNDVDESRVRRCDMARRNFRRTLSVSDQTWMRNLAAYTRQYLTIPDPSSQKLNWTKPPLSVLIIRKHLDESVLFPFRDLVMWLVEEKNMLVYVERVVLEEGLLVEDEDFQLVQDKLKSFREGVDDLTDKVDFIICLGGDGTLLYVSSLFQGSVPPVMAFNMGSLGFLTPFQFYQDFKNEVSRVMQGSASLLLRYRLKCVVVKHDTEQMKEPLPHVKNIQKEHSLLKTHKLVLNEVVVDRGSSSFLSNLDLYIEGRRVTTVQGDGLIISTPTGSTAYAVAAGASMIHPSVPCILLTPICPHSLSFRPVVVPAGVEIKVMLSPGARGTAMVSFDGRDRLEIHQGDSLRITTASYPVPSICAADQIEDWFDGLAVCLNWNLRLHQRPLTSTNSLTSIDSFESDAMTNSQHSNGTSDKTLT